MNINTFDELKTYCEKENKKIYEAAQEIEAQKDEISVEDLRKIVKKNLDAMKDAIRNGLKSAEKSFSGLSGGDCRKLQAKFSQKASLLGVIFEKITTYALATSEENARMGKIVACPTAGSCGIVPSVLVSVSEEIGATEEEEINALITAGEIGRIISNKVQLAGAVAGCQAECGVASAMMRRGISDGCRCSRPVKRRMSRKYPLCGGSCNEKPARFNLRSCLRTG